MKKFMDENFLLFNKTAVNLYNEYAVDQPIIDFHCHISPEEIYKNKKFRNITEVWLYGDHYKWRAMRANGIDEKYITGDGSDYDKFMAWARTVPMTIGNPLYHWTHLELQRFFNIYEVLNERTAPAIWERVNELLSSEGFRARDLIKKSNVKVVVTTDDPADTLKYHKLLKEDKGFDVKVLPAFRPDNALALNKASFAAWVKRLAEAACSDITSYRGFLKALSDRVEFFNSAGCRISDHSLDTVVYSEASEEETARIFEKALKGEKVSEEEENKYRTYTLRFLAKLYYQYGWAMQLHMAAFRNLNTNMFEKLGADKGYDSMNDESIAYGAYRLLDSLEREKTLPKTVLYSLNPKDNYTLGTMAGNFQGDGIPGRIQLGAAWWFNDNRDGMLSQMRALANVGLLSRFIGMLTDSRSFLSYPRHEYFRRILCNMIGEWVENGEIPDDPELLGGIIKGICYKNAKEYFGI